MMETLYYPYLYPKEKTAYAIAACFGKLYSLTPLALRPRFSIPAQKFLDPLPTDWKESFRSLLYQYRLFTQIYTDRSFLEYLKFVPPQSDDEEKTSVLISLLKGKDIKKTSEIPKEVISALFLYLAEQYRQNIFEIYQRIKHITIQEEALKEIFDAKEEIKIPDFINPRLDYTHPDEGLNEFLDKILKAFSYLLPEKEFPIFVTDDEVVHQYVKEKLKELPFFSYTLYFDPSKKMADLWPKLIELPKENISSHLNNLLALYQKPSNDSFSIEILFFPSFSAKEIFLKVLTKIELKTKNKNAIFAYWR